MEYDRLLSDIHNLSFLQLEARMRLIHILCKKYNSYYDNQGY